MTEEQIAAALEQAIKSAGQSYHALYTAVSAIIAACKAAS